MIKQIIRQNYPKRFLDFNPSLVCSGKPLIILLIHLMKIKAAWKYAVFFVGVALTAIVAYSLWFKGESDCVAAQEQTVVQWKDMYWFPCKYSWNEHCIWPIRRRHITYKVTINEGIPLRDEKGMPIPMGDGKIREWTVYDSAAWNGLEKYPSQKSRYPDYEPIAANEYVVLVETRYRWFHNVEATLRICTEKP